MKVLAVVLALAACHASPAPSRALHVPRDVGTLVVDGEAFAAFARELRGMLGSKPDDLFVLAMLDGLDGQWPAAVAKLDAIAAADPNPRSRAMRGLTIRVWADGGSFRDALAARVDALPKEAAADLSELRAMATVFTPEVCSQLVRESVHVSAGTVMLADAHTIVFQRYAVVRLVPVAKDIDAVLAARGIELPK